MNKLKLFLVFVSIIFQAAFCVALGLTLAQAHFNTGITICFVLLLGVPGGYGLHSFREQLMEDLEE